MDCVLNYGTWVSGSFVTYDFLNVLKKSNWDTCNREVLDYVWKFPSHCNKEYLHQLSLRPPEASSSSTLSLGLQPSYSRSDMCSILSGKTIMIVGDSISNEHFVTFASALWPPSEKQPEAPEFEHYDHQYLLYDDASTFFYNDTGANNVGLTIPCFDDDDDGDANFEDDDADDEVDVRSKDSFKLIFVRNYNLTTNDDAPDFWFEDHGRKFKDKPRPWLDRIGEENVDFLILNRGAHTSTTIIPELERTFSAVHKTYPQLKVMWRNTPSGHPSCGDTLTSPPLKTPPDLSAANSAFHWNSFHHVNTQVRKLISSRFPQVLYLNVSHPTEMRRDSHVSAKDCLHYCIPGPIDNWITWVVHAVLSFELNDC